jgi:C2 domain
MDGWLIFRNLKDRDYLSKSDPMCVVFMKDSVKNVNFREIGRTERLMNSLNPEWSTKMRINYFFEESQKLKFEM